MALDTIVVCSDGSDLALHAASAGFALLQPATKVFLVTVIEPADPSLVSGTGFAGAVVSPAEYDEMNEERTDDGAKITAQLHSALGLDNAEMFILEGDAGPALCAFASQVSADAIVMGSRGRGGLKRALLGSVSDHVVRNAPCPVVLTGHPD